MKKFWPTIKNPLITASFVLLGLLLYSHFSYILPFGRPPVTDKTALFKAQGTAEATYTPDTALIYLGVDKTAATQEEAKAEANKIISQVTAELKKLGVEDKNIKTTSFSVNPNYDYGVMTSSGIVADTVSFRPGSPRQNGYAANVSLEVRVTPVDKAEKVIDAVTKAGATQVGTSQLVLDEKKQKELEDQVQLEAIKNAKEKAKSLANAAGIRLGRVVDVQESGGGYPMPFMRTMELKAEDAAAAMPATELNPGENKVSMTVVLSYETY